MGAMNGTSPLNFVLLSGHDTTFIPFLAAVAPAAWDHEWPPYASLATIELLRVGGRGVGDGGAGIDAGSDQGGGDSGNDDDNDDLDAGGGGGDVGDDVGGGGVGDFYFRFVYNGEVLKLEGCDHGE